MGILVDIVNATISIPEEKINEIKTIYENFTYESNVSRKEFQSLLGKLLYVHKCIPPAHVFINRMLQLFRSQHTRTISLNINSYKYPHWFNRFWLHYNSKSIVTCSKPTTHVYLDASLSGVGTWWQGHCYAASLNTSALSDCTIVHTEMINVDCSACLSLSVGS